MEARLSVLLAAFGLVTVGATLYNFRRAPHEEASRNRSMVLLAIALYALGVSGDITGLLASLPGLDWYTGEFVAHVAMLIGSAVFLGFSLKTYRRVRRHLGGPDAPVHRHLGRTFVRYPHLPLCTVAVAALIPAWIYVVAAGPTYAAQAAMNDASHFVVAIVLLVTLWVWIDIERLTRGLRNFGFALSVMILAESAHFLEELGIWPSWNAVAYLALLLVAMTFWISATFEVADGR